MIVPRQTSTMIHQRKPLIVFNAVSILSDSVLMRHGDGLAGTLFLALGSAVNLIGHRMTLCRIGLSINDFYAEK